MNDNGNDNHNPTPKAIVITFDDLGNVSVSTSRPDVTLADYVMASWVLSRTAGQVVDQPNREARRSGITPIRGMPGMPPGAKQ